jgi:hypothetical protein
VFGDRKMFQKVIGSEQFFFFVARHYYLTGRPNRLFFRFRGEGVRGGPGGVPGGVPGPRGVPGGVPGGVQNQKTLQNNEERHGAIDRKRGVKTPTKA